MSEKLTGLEEQNQRQDWKLLIRVSKLKEGYGINDEDQNRCSLPMEFAIQTKRIQMTIARVREH